MSTLWSLFASYDETMSSLGRLYVGYDDTISNPGSLYAKYDDTMRKIGSFYVSFTMIKLWSRHANNDDTLSKEIFVLAMVMQCAGYYASLLAMWVRMLLCKICWYNE